VISPKTVNALKKLASKFAAKTARAIKAERKKQAKMEKYWRGKPRKP